MEIEQLNMSLYELVVNLYPVTFLATGFLIILGLLTVLVKVGIGPGGVVSSTLGLCSNINGWIDRLIEIDIYIC